ncbi:hypothetical protein D3C79_658770 [compost metagenome]
MQLQLRKRLTEEELTGQAKAMYRTLTVLANEHFVEVGLKDLALVIVQFQQQGHHGLGQLTTQAALIGQVEVLDQLLGQGTTALAHGTGGGVDPDGTGNGFRRHAKVAVEVTVFHSNKGFEQVRRHLVKLDQNPVFEVLRVQAADQQRLQTYHVELGTIDTAKPGNIVTRKAHPHRLRLFHAFIELETTGIEFDGIAIDRGSARAVGDAFTAIAQRIELDEEIALAQLLSDKQLQRPGIDLGRDSPALAGEFLLDHCVEVDGKAGQHHKADQTELDGPAEPGARGARRAFFRGTGGSGTSHGGGLYALY